MQVFTFSPTIYRNLAFLFVLLSLAPVAVAEVFKCVEEVTGKVVFTDQACPNDRPGQIHPVGPANADSGLNPKAVPQKNADSSVDSMAVPQKSKSRDLEQQKTQSKWQNRKEVIVQERRTREAERESKSN